MEVGGDGHQHAGFGRAVEFGDRERRHANGALELAHLGERVLADAGVQHQQHLVRRALVQPAHDPFDFLQLLHQPALGLKAPGGVRQHHVHFPRQRRLHGVENDGGAVGALALLHNGHGVARAPCLELIHGGGAERVAGRQQHRAALVPQPLRQFADERGFAGAVHAHDQHHMRARRANREGLGHRREDRAEFPRQRVAQRLRVLEFAARHARLDRVHDPGGGGHAHVGEQQAGFQLLQHRLVDGAFAAQEIADAARDVPPRFGERAV